MRLFRFIFIAIVPALMSLTVPEIYLDEIKQMKKTFDQKDITVNLGYIVYSKSNSTILESKSGKYEMSDNNYSYVLDNVKIIQNDQWNVYVDTEDKLVVVKERDVEKKANDILSFDIATEGLSSLTRKEVGKNYVYTLIFKKPVSSIYSQIQIVATKSSLSPKKIILDYAYDSEYVTKSGKVINDYMRFEIRYNSVIYSAKKNYSTDGIFKMKDNQLELVGDYVNYRLLDQRVSRITGKK